MYGSPPLFPIWSAPMILFTLLISAASGADQDKWECGPEHKWKIIDVALKKLSKGLIGDCHETVQDDANLCCKAHDYCYDTHIDHGVNRTHCDEIFCHCLQDVTDKGKDRTCLPALHNFCAAVSDFGRIPFENSKPNDNEDLAVGFNDTSPLGLEMQRLVDTCRYSRKLALHCHYSVAKCLAKPHDRAKRDIVYNSYEDCHSTMFDCLQVLIESETNESCIAIARNISKQLQVNDKLDEVMHGKAIIATYPIVAARLLKQCHANSRGPLESCYRNFTDCAVENRQEPQEYFNAARRIKIECHQNLTRCISDVTWYDTTDDCNEARNLAVQRIRMHDHKVAKAAEGFGDFVKHTKYGGKLQNLLRKH